MDLISSLVSEDTHDSGSDEYKHNDDDDVGLANDEFAVVGGDKLSSNSTLPLLPLSLLICVFLRKKFPNIDMML